MLLAVNSPVFVIIGPTGVGKTDLTIHLANKFNGEIVSADSRYLYRGMDIGTAKPAQSQLDTVKHHLVDVADINHPWSLAVYQREAVRAMEDIIQRGKLPFLVGGTGQYIHCLTQGWIIPPQKPVPGLREVLELWARQIGSDGLHARLHTLDPDAAAMIDHRNIRRTIRALEVILATGKKFSGQRRKGAINFRFEVIGLTRHRESLYHRIDERIDEMIAKGLIEEVTGLLKAGYGLHHPPLSAIGYKEITQYLEGKISLSESVLIMRKRTRQFVRRQANWFKLDDPAIQWFDLDQVETKMIETFIQERLSDGQ